jgi:hypothetical protein
MGAKRIFECYSNQNLQLSLDQNYYIAFHYRYPFRGPGKLREQSTITAGLRYLGINNVRQQIFGK